MATDGQRAAVADALGALSLSHLRTRTTSSAAASPAIPSPPRLDIPACGTLVTNDGCVLHYERFGAAGPPVVLVHGWSGSRHYWDLNVRKIARSCQVITYGTPFNHHYAPKPHFLNINLPLLIVLQTSGTTVQAINRPTASTSPATPPTSPPSLKP
jgi:hypothetical protein